MGRAKKEHNRKVAKRNERIATEKKKFQKQYTELLEQKLQEYQAKLTEKEQLENQLEVSLGDQELGFTIIDPNKVDSQTLETNQ